MIRNLSVGGAQAGSSASSRLQPRQAVLWLRAGAVLALIVCAYHQSLITLFNGLRLETPLAYLALVPVVALFLVLVRSNARRREPDIHDRYLDYLVGLPLISIALAVVVVAPVYLSTFFWLWRLDLITLPLFAAGAVALAFGARAAWRLRLPLAFLLLAWPPPYVLFLSQQLEAFTSLTVGATRAALRVVPLAQPLDTAGSSLFLVATSPAHSFVVAVNSACSGVNSMVGFLLVATACLTVIRGPIAGRLAWLGLGLAVVWALDVVRIMAIFGAGHAWGETFAMEALHPVIGILFFNLGLLAMVCLMPLFRLRFDAGRLMAWLSALRAARPSVSGPLGAGAVSRPRAALVLLVAASLVAAAANTRLPEFELVAHDLGAPRFDSSTVLSSTVPGWSMTQVEDFSWVRTYLGPGATWVRYDYAPTPGGPSPVSAGARQLAPITLDVISTSDLAALSAYSPESCYQFQDVQVVDSSRTALGAGVVAKALTYRNPTTGSMWTLLYWEWPVRSDQRELYQRVVLYMGDPGDVPAMRGPSGGPLSALQVAIANGFSKPGEGSPAGTPGTARTREFLIRFGHQVVMAAAGQPDVSVAEAAPR